MLGPVRRCAGGRGNNVEQRSGTRVLERDLSVLVRDAAEGDQQAWAALVERFSGLVWSVTRAFRLSRADAADVCQTAWLRLVEHLGDIREPERVGAWLATTTRRECLLTLQKAGRAIPTEFDDDHLVSPDATADLDGALDAGQHQAALWRALEELPERGRAVLRVLMAEPAPSYAEAAAALGVPIGSLGPTRARCLERLRNSPELAGITAGVGGSSF